MGKWRKTVGTGSDTKPAVSIIFHFENSRNNSGARDMDLFLYTFILSSRYLSMNYDIYVP